MRRLLCHLSFLCVLGATVAAARADAAVSDYLGKPIGSVRLMVEGRETTEAALTQVVSTVAGQPLSMLQVRETMAHLFSLGRFEGVTVDAVIDEGRVALRYDLIPIHPVAFMVLTSGQVYGLPVSPELVHRTRATAGVHSASRIATARSGVFAIAVCSMKCACVR